MTSSLSSTPITPDTTPSQTASQQKRKNSHGLTTVLNASRKRKRRPGRPLLSFAQLRARQAARESARRAANAWKFSSQQTNGASGSTPREGPTPAKRNGSSALERLPVELLERIFLYALETNFCRASPFLASAVSSERIYRTLIRLAFYKDDGDFPSVSGGLRYQIGIAHDAIADALKPADYRTMLLDEPDRVNLQATILKCRWCTKKRILMQLPALTQMLIWRHWVGAGMAISDSEQKESLRGVLQARGSDLITKSVPWCRFEGVDPSGKVHRASVVLLEKIAVHYINERGLEVEEIHRVLDIRVIPDHLLHGRRQEEGDVGYYFTNEDLDLLEIFRYGYGLDGCGHDVQFSRDALQSGIRTAIRTWHDRALSTLLRLDEFMFRQRLEHDPPPGFPNRRTGEYYAIPQDFFLQAIQLPMPDAMHCFLLLLRCNAESMPPDSSELTQWAMDLASYRPSAESGIRDSDVSLARGLGRWLLDFMIELPGYVEESREDARFKSIFYKGRLNAPFTTLGQRFLDEVCGFISRDFKYWEGEEEHWERLMLSMSKHWEECVQQS